MFSPDFNLNPAINVGPRYWVRHHFDVRQKRKDLQMNLKHHNGHHFLVHLTLDELHGISNALNEVCNRVHLDDAEFETRLGQSREQLKELLGEISQGLSSPPSDFEIKEAWAEGCSVQARCFSAYGDPADMSSGEAREFASCLIAAADEADSL